MQVTEYRYRGGPAAGTLAPKVDDFATLEFDLD